MSESRICPVCDYDIPEDARFLCPHCQFELIWLEDERMIERAKQSFTGEIYKPEIKVKKPVRKLGAPEFLFQIVLDFIFDLFWNILKEALD
ncbi:MAG: hypothetical protein P8Y72_04110 [Anaerolineales bacterium]